MKHVIMSGISGHTGRAIAKCIDEDPNLKLVAGIGNKSVGKSIGRILYGQDDDRYIYADIHSAIQEHDSDVYVDFTNPESAKKNLSDVELLGMKIFVGTTGIDKNFLLNLEEKIKDDNLFAVISSNFSLGIISLVQIAKELSTSNDIDNIEIIETHNNSKKDMPSGTALYLQSILKSSNNRDIPIISRRISSHVSIHEIYVSMYNQTLSFKHEAISPTTFGHGVVYAINNCDNKTGVYKDLTSFIIL